MVVSGCSFSLVGAGTAQKPELEEKDSSADDGYEAPPSRKKADSKWLLISLMLVIIDSNMHVH